ncbi:MAG: hypothetical protein COB15_16930 [Flavobacteriales bacterium]|nr:MAG: hypothetical protein COB15_16930 [Flavobacteriales bacterium]
MINYKAFKDCISDQEDELIIYASDSFSQFPQRNLSATSKSDRAIPVASSNDLVVLRGELDSEYHQWLRSFGLGSDFIVDYGEPPTGMTLSELIINNPEPIQKIIKKTGRKPVYVPWFSGDKENEVAKILEGDLFGAPESETLKYNDKASFKLICQQLNIPVVGGVSFKMQSLKEDNYMMMENIIKGYLQRYSTVILRGALGEFGMSLYKTQGDDIAEIYKEISATGEKIIIIEPFLNVSSSPGDQWVISRDGSINHVGMQDQICKEGMIHTGTINTVVHSVDDSAYIVETSRKIVNEMARTGYIGVVGIDYIVSDEGIFPVENNARFNGSSYPILIVDQIKQLNIEVPVWKFIKFKTTPCTFLELQNRLKLTIFDGEKSNSIFPFNCEALSDTGSLSFIFLAENKSQILELEEKVRDLCFCFV